jgi:hypothetical protein
MTVGLVLLILGGDRLLDLLLQSSGTAGLLVGAAQAVAGALLVAATPVVSRATRGGAFPRPSVERGEVAAELCARRVPPGQVISLFAHARPSGRPRRRFVAPAAPRAGPAGDA